MTTVITIMAAIVADSCTIMAPYYVGGPMIVASKEAKSATITIAHPVIAFT